MQIKDKVFVVTGGRRAWAGPPQRSSLRRRRWYCSMNAEQDTRPRPLSVSMPALPRPNEEQVTAAVESAHRPRRPPWSRQRSGHRSGCQQ